MKEKFLQLLYEITLKGDVQWNLHNNTFSRYYYRCNPDDKTTVQIEILLDGKLTFQSVSTFTIKNEDFIKKTVYVSTYDENVIKIGKLLFDRDIKHKLQPVTITEDDVFEKIINNMPSKQIVRDTKIRTILT